MVRFLPPQLARLMTLALQARVHQDGLAPATMGAPAVGAARAVGAMPADPFGVAGGPTGYRATSFAAASDASDASDAVEERPRGIRRFLNRMRRSKMPAKRYSTNFRTAKDASVPPEEALKNLIAGNKRFVAGTADMWKNGSSVDDLAAMAALGQSPFASVVGCADSRAPVEILFDARPGDLFVLRNAGNTLTNAEGSLVGSLEFSVGALGVKFILFLGHTQCGAIKGATARTLDAQANPENAAPQGVLDRLLVGLSPVVEQAQLDLGANATAEAIANAAVEVNVFAGMQKLLLYSEPIREKVRTGEVEVHGAVFDIKTGEVKFLGQHPKLPTILALSASYSGLNK